MFAAVRRGLLLEELARSVGDDEMRSEMFICGVFSLLDRIFNQPFADLLKSIPCRSGGPGADREQRALPALRRARAHAVEGQSLLDIRAAAERLMLGIGEINRAQLRALARRRSSSEPPTFAGPGGAPAWRASASCVAGQEGRPAYTDGSRQVLDPPPDEPRWNPRPPCHLHPLLDRLTSRRRVRRRGRLSFANRRGPAAAGLRGGMDGRPARRRCWGAGVALAARCDVR